MWINPFPAEQGISKYLALRKIVLKRSLIFERHTKCLFGSYVEMNKDVIITNTNRVRTFTSILLSSTGNIQGTQKGFYIKTGAMKKCRTIRNMLMPQAVIKSVHDWENISARGEHQNRMLFFGTK